MRELLTMEEIEALFGDKTIPLAAVEAIHSAAEADIPVSELRAQLESIAAEESADKVTTYYPIQVVVEVGVTDGTTTGTLFCKYESMKLPTEGALRRILGDVIAAAPDNMRLMTRHEYLTIAAFNMTGEKKPVTMSPLKANERWHDPDATNILCTWWMDLSKFDA